jgi:hypothetical protein
VGSDPLAPFLLCNDDRVPGAMRAWRSRLRRPGKVEELGGVERVLWAEIVEDGRFESREGTGRNGDSEAESAKWPNCTPEVKRPRRAPFC